MKKRVLIIDDSSYMRGKIRTMFREEDFETAEADSGMAALQSSAAQAFDVILLDIIMPGMDGLKVLKAFTEQRPQTPVIVVTADIQESVSRQCISLGAKA